MKKKTSPKVMPRICSWNQKERYKGQELTQTCQRPGAYDFLNHPSLINGQLCYHKDAKP